MTPHDIQHTAQDGLHMLNVSHAFGDHQVVSGVSVFVKPGELVCLLGPSGCGKTTLLRLAAGLEELQVGRITMGQDTVADGKGGRQLPPEKRNVGLMFQDFALFPHLSVFDNVVFGLAANDTDRRAWARDMLATMGLADYADAFPHVLSGGQQQRVALLRALAPAPRILLLDEPFSGLDVNRRAQIRRDTFNILARSGIATLMVTHDPEEAMFMADRILVMQDGRIVQSGKPVDIYFHPQTTFVAELFGPVNRLPGRVENGNLVTVLGRFPAPAIAEGSHAELLIRPEALELSTEISSDGETAVLTVLTARSLGRSTHLTLALADDAGDIVLDARMPGVFQPETGTRVGARIAPENLLIFPVERG
jgi:iron(III) transport system ATP-binding protein